MAVDDIVTQTLVDGLGVSHDVAHEVVRAVAEDRPLREDKLDGTADGALAAGAFRSVGADLVVTPWLRRVLGGDVELSAPIESRRLAVTRLAGPAATVLADLLTHTSPTVELVAPRASLAACYAAEAISSIGLVPIALQLDDLSEPELLDLLVELNLQCRVLGLAAILLFEHGSGQSRRVIEQLQVANWPAVLLVEERTRNFVPAAPFATYSCPPDTTQVRRRAWADLLDDDTLVAAELDRLAHLPLGPAAMSETRLRAQCDPVGLERLRHHALEVLLERGSHLAGLQSGVGPAGVIVHPPSLQTLIDEFSQAAAGMLEVPVGERRGLRALLTGPSGTGKSATAGAIGTALGLPTLFVDVSKIVDKYIGETEKNLNAILTEAESVNALLVFDEGEALFGSRGAPGSDTGRDAANRQVSYLLARLEQHRGLVLVLTNYPGGIDKAFLRRFHFHLTFAAPSAEQRVDIWREQLTAHGLAEGVDFVELASFDFTGGHIANICFIASLLDDGVPARASTIERLCMREYASMGRKRSL